MKIQIIFFFVFVSVFTACKTVPNTNLPGEPEKKPESLTNSQQVPSQNPQASTDENIIIAQFDMIKITKQTFNTVKSEIEHVVDNLNKITLAKDYYNWLTYLSDEYSQNFSNPDVLEKVSASLPVKGVQLKTLKDYFQFVFVPSRQNLRVDDIQFVSPTRVNVFMDIAPNSPAAIYILEKTTNGWKLVLKNQ